MLLKNKKKFSFYFSLIILSITLVSCALIINNYSKKVSINIVQIWLDAEKINLQQGNYLSSVTKIERLLLKKNSEISGVALVKIDNSAVSELYSIGKKIEIPQLNKFENLFTTNSLDFFYLSDFIIYAFIDKDKVIIFNFSPESSKWIIFFLSFYNFIMILFFLKINSQYLTLNAVYKTKLKLRRLKEKKIQFRRNLNDALTLAHDIRSPISTLNIISKKIESQEIKDLHEAVIKQINTIAERVLSKNKLSSKKNTNSIKKNNLKYIELISLVLTEFSEKSVFIKYKTNFDLNNISNYPPDFLYSSLNNMIQNSIEATSKVSQPIIEISTEIKNNFIIINITDNGVGIPSDKLKFFGKENFTIGKEGTSSGNGIAVLNTSKMLEKIGGRLLVNSKENLGTLISICIPITLFTD